MPKTSNLPAHDEVRRLSSLEGAEINKAKEVLAFEVTKLIHGEVEAIKAQNAAKALFQTEPTCLRCHRLTLPGTIGRWHGLA